MQLKTNGKTSFYWLISLSLSFSISPSPPLSLSFSPSLPPSLPPPPSPPSLSLSYLSLCPSLFSTRLSPPLTPTLSDTVAKKWLELDHSEIEKQLLVVSVHLFSPFLFGLAHQSDRWLQWCHEVGLLVSELWVPYKIWDLMKYIVSSTKLSGKVQVQICVYLIQGFPKLACTISCSHFSEI